MSQDPSDTSAPLTPPSTPTEPSLEPSIGAASGEAIGQPLAGDAMARQALPDGEAAPVARPDGAQPTGGTQAGAATPRAEPGLAEASSAPSAGPQAYPVRFGGQGVEYFKIWIVNLLLTLATFGLYYPWAKVRKLRYFANHTYVDGHSLEFHGDPLRILRGTLLFGALMVVVNVAQGLSPLAYAVSVAVLWTLFPLLWRASMRFRLANTSWRGIRLRFAGDVKGAYLPFLPLYAALSGLVIAGALQPQAEAGAKVAPALDPGLMALASLSFLAALLLWPACHYLMKRYQHSHYRMGQWQTRFQAGAWDFYKLYLKLAGLLLLPVLVLPFLLMSTFFATNNNPIVLMAGVVLALFLGVGVLLLLQMLVKPYLVTRLHNLVWDRTGHPQLQFRSRLRLRDYIVAYLLNGLLTMLTMGLYWPLAQVALAKLRLESLTIESQVPLSDCLGELAAAERDATGDAAGDLLGIDISL